MAQETDERVIAKISDDDLAFMVEIYVKELARRDYKRTRKLLARTIVELIDDKMD